MTAASPYGTFSGQQRIQERKSRMNDAAHRNEGVDAETGLSRKIGTVPLAVIVFYTVSGGPFGIEESVRAGGALFAILGFAIMPFIWSIPEALVTAELASAYPEASGTVAWVEEAFGGFGGWLQGCLTWTSGATDNAIYPVLFLDYALQMFGAPDDLDPWLRFSVLSGTCLGLAYVNYRGLDVVGNMSLTVCALSMSPFVVFCLMGAFQLDPLRWLQTPDTTTAVTDLDNDTGTGLFPGIALGGVLWRPFLNNLFWNLNSFDSAACFAGEITDPGRSFPKAMFGAVLMVILGYLLPLMIAIGTTNASQSEWVDGYMATIVTEAVGPWLGAWVVFAAGISNLAMFQGEMSSDAFQILGMAERGYLPKMFAKRSRYGTPVWGIALGAAVILAMSVTDLSSLIEMLNFNYSISLLMEYAAFIKLRIFKPDLERPYCIPLSTTGCVILLIPPMLMTIVVMLLASFITYVYAAMTIIVALIVYKWRRQEIEDRDYNLVDSQDDEVGEVGEDEAQATDIPAPPANM